MAKKAKELPADAGISTLEELCWRADEAHARRLPWHSVLQEAYELANPWRNPYTEQAGEPATLGNLFDSTAIVSTFRSCNRLLTDLVPPHQEWCGIQLGPLLKMRASKSQQETYTRQIYDIQLILSLIFKSERFINSMWECFLDMLVAGLGSMLVLDDPMNDIDPIIFQTVSQAEISTEDGPDGSNIGVFRRPKMKLKNIKRHWRDAKLPEELTKDMGDKRSQNKNIPLLEATEKREDGKGWVYRVLYRGKDKAPVELVRREYNTNPWVLFPWSKIPGCEYGPGPVLLMLADIRTANKVREFVLKNAALALAGMYLVRDDGVLNPDNIQIVAGGMIPVASTGGSVGSSMVPLTTNREFDVGQIVLQDLQTSIKQGLFDVSLPAMDGTRRSATEIVNRMQQLTQDVGGAIGRMTSALVALVRRVVDVLGERGLIPKIKIDNFLLQVQINSPLAQAQQLQEVEKVVRYIEMCKAVGGDRYTMLVAKLEEILVWMAEQIGIAPMLVRNETERLEYKQQEAQMAVAQAAGAMPVQAA